MNRVTGDDKPEHQTTTRRAVVRGAAWTLPVVAAAATAPAYAASCAQRQTVSTSWSTIGEYTRTGSYSGTWTRNLGPLYGTVRVDITSNPVGNIKAGTFRAAENRNFVANTGTVSGLVMPLQFQQSPNSLLQAYGGFANRQEITLTFTPNIDNLRFTVGDIDSQSGTAAYDDRLDLIRSTSTSTTGVFSFTNGSTILATSNGGQASPSVPWQPLNNNSPIADTASTGNVALSTPATGSARTSSVVIRYWSATTSGLTSTTSSDPQQRFYLSNLTFDVRPVGCP